MGIRFYCPNGHKLNVKSFQAGERGICPHCGIKFTIPNESTRPSSKELETNNPPTLDPLPSPGVATPGSDCEPSAVADPLAEDSEAAWYVRPPEGDQFGPASADVMRGWIDEGRVTGESLVWREGWRDWVKAATVLPQLGAGRPPGPTEIVVDPRPTTWNRPQRRSHNTTAIVITVLVLLIIILSVVFFWVLSGSPDGATAFLGGGDMVVGGVSDGDRTLYVSTVADRVASYNLHGRRQSRLLQGRIPRHPQADS